MANFSSDGAVVVERQLNVNKFENLQQDLVTANDLKRCLEWIESNDYQRICLQFPDEMLTDAVQVSSFLCSKTKRNFFIMADTSYSSCCVDEVAAAHVAADAVIHFGPACLGINCNVPVLHVFQNGELNLEKLLKCVKGINFEETTAVLYETKFHKHLPILTEAFKQLPSFFICPIVEGPLIEGYNNICGRALPCSKNFKNAIFIGSDSMLLTNLALMFRDVSWWIYDDEELKEYQMQTSKFLMKRLYLVEKVKDAASLGILVGTLSIDGCLTAVDRIKTLCKGTGKKCYIVAVGRPNVAKLANFPEIDVFTLVSCPENNLFIENSEFYQPIVSLLEVELALGERPWSTEYSLDFRQFLSGGKLYVADEGKVENDKEPDVSLVTGRLRTREETTVNAVATDESALVTREPGTVMVSKAAQFLSERSWGGLEQNLGQTPVEKAKQGRRGVPLGYQNEGATGEKLKVLCLHGYRQDGNKLRQQSGALRKILKSVVDMEFLSAPFTVQGEGETSRSWWFTQRESFSSKDEVKTSRGLEESIALIESTWNEKGPFDGLMGFSQGACLVGLLSAMCLKNLTSIKPRFVMLVSGFRSRCKAHDSWYPEQIPIPSLHVIGETDEVIPCEWGKELSQLYVDPTIISHSGGHFVPGTSNLKSQYHNFFTKFKR